MEPTKKTAETEPTKRERKLNRFPFTEDRVRRLPLWNPEARDAQGNVIDKYPVLYLDSKMSGFMAICYREFKTYYFQFDRPDPNGRRGRKTTRVKIERTDAISLDDAWTRAREILNDLKKGIHPKEKEREELKARIATADRTGFTLADAVKLHFDRPKIRSAKTIAGYQSIFDTHLRDWMDRPLKWIGDNPEEVEKLHLHITKFGWDTEARKGRGRRKRKGAPYSANGMVRALRAVYKFAKKKKTHLGLPDFPEVEFNEESSSDKHVPLEELPAWFKAVMGLENTIRRDAHLFAMFSGRRLTEAMSAEWKNVNWEEKSIFFPRPKGGAKRAFWAPLSSLLIGVLEARKADAATHAAFPDSPLIFPAVTKTGYIMDLKEGADAYLKKYSAKDYRHSFGSYGAACGLNLPQIKFLLNHKQEATNVTFRYAKALLDPMREDLEKITSYVFKKIGTSEQKALRRLVARERKIA